MATTPPDESPDPAAFTVPNREASQKDVANLRKRTMVSAIPKGVIKPVHPVGIKLGLDARGVMLGCGIYLVEKEKVAS